MFVVPQTVTFPTVTDSCPQIQSVTVHMPAPVSQAAALLTGFDVEYSHGYHPPAPRSGSRRKGRPRSPS